MAVGDLLKPSLSQFDIDKGGLDPEQDMEVQQNVSESSDSGEDDDHDS